jgi:(1->4)-alpha-D-glucan 1-alpha-D-glucosylmutase
VPTEPRTAHPVPSATYRLQLSAGFTFDDAAARVGYLHRLGVSHVYLSPILQAAPGSSHGYDVIDHDRIAAELGGEPAFRRLIAALHERGMGAIADVVPNHMGMPVPETGNRALWSVLRDGPHSPFASWFDIDWDAQAGAVLLPVLGRRIGQCVRAGELKVDTAADGAPVLRYFDHVFPLRPGTETLDLPELLDAQHYRLAHWRVAAEETGYRRFFDISTLIAVRVEDPEVFAATHRLLLDLVRDGSLDGLRIDHPDGLADPRGYLRRLAEAVDGRWTVVEKILGAEDTLPEDWPCAGTTGYDAQRVLTALLVDPAGAAQLTALYTGLTGQGADYAEVARQARLDVLDQVLHAELGRLTDLPAAISHGALDLRDHTVAALHECVRALLALMPVYRAYCVPGEEPPGQTVAILEAVADEARALLPEDRHDTLMLVRDLALGRIGPRDRLRDEFQTRFQQTCGPVVAKGVEDTAFYRWPALPTAAEVGGDPAAPALEPSGFHRFCAGRHAAHPTGMTALTTHDTKRSEDVRARLAVLSELPQEWAGAVAGWQAATDPAAHPAAPDAAGPDPVARYLAWQTLVGCWPIDRDRLTGYLVKAAREAKVHTSWTSPHEDYEASLRDFAESVFADPDLCAAAAAFAGRIGPYAEINGLTQKLLQLTMTGVPDLYQGTETWFLALVDPDNRRPVDFDALDGLLARADADAAGSAPAGQCSKIAVVSRALRLRRDHPDWFGPGAVQSPLLALGPAAGHAVAFLRGEHVAVLGTRLPVGLEHLGGWGDTVLALPDGAWRCALSGRVFRTGGHGGAVPIADLLLDRPVALLVRQEAP